MSRKRLAFSLGIGGLAAVGALAPLAVGGLAAVGALAALAVGGWTDGGFLTVDGSPITVRSVDCRTAASGPGMTVQALSPRGWPGAIYVARIGQNTVNAPPTGFAISWDVFRSLTWTNEGPVTYWHGYLHAT